MKDVVFLLSDVWMIFVGYYYGLRFIRRYDNYLLGIEWMIVATSGSNFIVWSLLGAHKSSPLYDLAYFFDAFSRSVGITAILVMGFLRVTRGYKPSLPVDVGIFVLGAVAGLYLRHFHDQDIHTHTGAYLVAAFYVVANLAASTFMAYVAARLWEAGCRAHAVWTALITVAAAVIAMTYDFFPLSFDDADRTYFYTAALATWGTQGFVYFRAYRALHDHHAVTGRRPAPQASAVS